jgi:hypothetical protein
MRRPRAIRRSRASPGQAVALSTLATIL